MSQQRYEEIMRRLALKQQQQTARPAQQRLEAVLNALNALDTLVTTQQATPRGIIPCGTKTTHCAEPCTVGVVGWLRPSGFYGYRTLILLGVWAQAVGEAVRVCVGSKRLAYAQATYNPEAYHTLIRRDYRPYYQDDLRPPASALLAFDYMPEERLARRTQIAQTLAAYVTDS